MWISYVEAHKRFVSQSGESVAASRARSATNCLASYIPRYESDAHLCPPPPLPPFPCRRSKTEILLEFLCCRKIIWETQTFLPLSQH